MIYDNKFYKEIENIMRKHIDEFNKNNMLMEKDLFFDRNIQRMSPFDPDGVKYTSWGGGIGKNNKFYEELRTATEEREVDYIYNKYFQKIFKEQITHPFKCDGLINTETSSGKKLKIIFEYKYNYDFTKKKEIADVLIQVIYYLKKFEDNGQPLPNICFVGDVDECFVMHTDSLNKYLDESIDWDYAPSNAKFANSALISKIVSDKEINPFIFCINEQFNLQEVISHISNLAENVQRHIHITTHNINSIYEYFCDMVLNNRNKLTTNESVAVFIGVLSDKEEYYIHPVKKNILVAAPLGLEVSIKNEAFKSFFSYFSDNYSTTEKRVFSSIADRLLEDTVRRHSGEFWTPTEWVDYVHQKISDTIGENWRDDFVVWDNCAGTCNLTRDYKFKELYISTLYDSELQMGMKFNREAEHFQFDFLNDDIPYPNDLIDINSKLPKKLLEAFKQNKKILFLLNPPYATAGNNKRDLLTKSGVAVTKVNYDMKLNGYGSSSQQLYAQFLYRIEKIKTEYNLTNCYIAFFSPGAYLTGTSYVKFRSKFLNDFEFLTGFQFNANNFSDVKGNWSVLFSIWKSGKCYNKTKFNVDNCIVDKNGQIKEIKINSTKTLYNLDNNVSASYWVRDPVKTLKVFDEPNMSSGIKIKDAKSNRGKNFKSNIGYFSNEGNSIGDNAQCVAMFSTAYSHGGGVGITSDNFTRCVSLFSARRLIIGNWTNWTDEYLAPNESHPDYREFVNDSVVFSLFESKSNQSSLRSVDYKDKSWDIKNEFFWLSTSDMQKLAEKFDNDDCYDDALTSDERFVYKYLQNITLSKEAQAVLDYATKLVYQSFEFRPMFDDDYPDYQINNWDCGYYQIKALWKAYMPEELAKFRTLFNNLANKMRPMVYELGFLKK